ncbi:MAG: hypothetical protein GY859_12575, partial [Desulfobacterales bacterium]|nr:hypothetical protein [Desulfobacterales bacterium]
PPLSLVEIIEMVEAEAAMSGESEIHAADVVESRPERTPPREKTMMADPAASAETGAAAVKPRNRIKKRWAGLMKIAADLMKSVIDQVKTAVNSREAARAADEKNAPKQDEATRFAWRPAKTGALERALETMSGWSSLAVPFMVRNIGWFIGGFLFIAGSIFLVIQTSGFARSLIIAVFLFGYTLLLLLGAHRLLRKEPGMRAACAIMITLGMLLIPLTITASVRILDMGWPNVAQTAAGALLLLINLGVFYWAAKLASGIMDRSLKGPHPKLFMIIAAVQIAAPITARAPHWPLLASLHLVLLGLLGWALTRFTRDWLKAILMDRNRTTCYAVGSLVHAALVSFVHLTARFGPSLPDGYAGPFLMILSGMLFYVDFHLKRWTKKYTWLSQFNFLVYGLSILSLALVLYAPGARLITLALGTVVYGAVVRQYRTLPPLYLTLACLAWLYGLLALAPLPRGMHFLAAAPGLAALVYMYHRALKQNAVSMARLFFRAFALLAGGLAAWSLYHAGPGFTAMATSLAITGALYAAIRFYPFHLLNGLGLASAEKSALTGEADLRGGPWLYAVLAAEAISLAYAPPAGPIAPVLQFAAGLALLALSWSATALRPPGPATEFTAKKAAVLLNGALLSIPLAIAMCVAGQPRLLHNPLLILVLALSAGILLWQGGVLRVRGLFCGALILGGAAGGLFKLTYFPGPSAALAESLVIPCAWGALLWLERREAAFRALGERDNGEGAPPLTLLWRTPTREKSLVETMTAPAQWAMGLVWFWVLFRLGWYIINYGPSWTWVVNTALTTLTSALLAVYFRRTRLCFVPVLLGLAALLGGARLLVGVNAPIWTVIAVFYALAAWALAVKAGERPLFRRLARMVDFRGGNEDARHMIPRQTFLTTCVIVLVAAAAALFHWLLHPGPAGLPAIIAGMFFLWLTGRYYRLRENSHLMLTLAALTTLILHAWAASFTDPLHLLFDPRVGLTLALSGVGAWVLARILDRFAHDTGDTGDPGDPDADFAGSLYRKPSRICAAALSLAAAGQASLHFLLASSPPFPSIFALGLAGAGLLLANHALGRAPLVVLGVIFSGLA